MLIRRLVIASLVAGAASAQAGNITTPVAQPSNVVSGWTTGNGTDVLGSGVLQGNLNLVAGVAHTANASLSDILYGKVAGSVEQAGGQTKLFFQRGIEANYLLASGHGILAATAGLGKSVVGDAYGAIISDGVGKLPGMTGGGNQTVNNGNSGNSGNSGNTSPTTTSGNSNSGKTTTGDSGTSGNTTGGNSSSTTPSTGKGNNSNGNNSNGNNSNGNNGGGILDQDTGLGNGALNGNGNGIGTGKGNGLGNLANQEAQAAEVPEPSSIALMLLGMMGAGAISRRRR